MRELRNVVQRAYVMTPGATIARRVPADERRRRQCAGGRRRRCPIRVGTSLAEVERQLTLATLEHFGRHKERTAAALGISLKTLYNRLKEYAADDGDPLRSSRARSTKCAEGAAGARRVGRSAAAGRYERSRLARLPGLSGLTKNESKPAASARCWSSALA